MQNQASAKQMYFYHKENGQMVMDRADHCDHLEQHHRRLGKNKPQYVAGTFEPLTDEEIKRYAGGAGVSANMSARPQLPPYEEPPDHAERRIKNEKLRAERKAK